MSSRARERQLALLVARVTEWQIVNRIAMTDTPANRHIFMERARYYRVIMMADGELPPDTPEVVVEWEDEFGRPRPWMRWRKSGSVLSREP